MSTEKEIDSYYKSGYMKLLDELRLIKYEHPESYNVMADMVRNYRTWVAEVSGIKTLPEVPKE